MRSLEVSRARWQVTIAHAKSLEALKKSVRLDGDESPGRAGLRSVCWKIFLLFQRTEVTGWSRTLVDSRSAYTSLREHLLRYIENPDEVGSALDPLDDDQHSPWNTLRQDEEIRQEIFQDVERCMPEEPYFRRPETQRMLLNILFIFCKINQDVGYRQGMHEILAPILWVVEQDAIENWNEKDRGPSTGDDSIMKQILDPAYIEHDAFTLLSLIMRSAKSFYELGEPDRRSSTPSTGSGTPQHGASPIVERSKRIHEIYLARLDPGLAKHLTDVEVLPQIFLIRWIRLLFGREFPFDELLDLWDALLAEDPALDLVDMVCVAMILRIRWQLIEANYSFALMLLLKYPAPEYPNGPQTFVDDAIYLRDNFSAADGAKIISKYSGKAPPLLSSDSRPSTPLGQALGHKRNISRTKSPLPSPARFLQQQGGVEALFQGAAKGVFDRGERLGINKAVRDAVGEVKKNMQGLQTSRNNSTKRRPSDGMRWSLDEGKSVSTSSASISAMNARNKQLARMLDQAMADLRAVSVSEDGDKEKYVKAMDLAIAKVEFVKVYLEDATMPLPDDSSNPEPSTPSPLPADTPPPPLPERLQDATHDPTTSAPTDPRSENNVGESAGKPLPAIHTPHIFASKDPAIAASPIAITAKNVQQNSIEAGNEGEVQHRPKAPVPTRSTIAQSSFSWMLEPDSPSGSSLKSSPPKSSSPFLKSSRRPASGSGREKAAFLFGEVDESPLHSQSRPRIDSETFNLGTIKGNES
ncbi:RabGAP/TBC [Hyaloscypha hepaticicola]|uniref:RabGAP/TBC n=1 Tax=Hyaloscypha hepaticicola TaxID=2082293 RepID=A0A2J6QD52_9HELO|nr:RabGAP/TBC [Hyaloscypha hepaticicola]